jgi:hypothetical protein
MPLGSPSFVSNVTNYLMDKGAGSVDDAAQFFTSETVSLINTGKPNSLPAASTSISAGTIENVWRTAFQNLFNGAPNNVSIWTPVANAIGTQLQAASYNTSGAGVIVTAPMGGAAGAGAGAAPLAQAFATQPYKEAPQVASLLDLAITTQLLATPTILTPPMSSPLPPVPGIA